MYADGASDAEDRPAFVRAASGIAWLGDELAIVQDDASFVALRAPDGAVRAVALPLGPGGRRRFEERLGNKSDKLDLEACLSVEGPRGPVLLGIGSGSLPGRERIALVEPHGPEPVRVVDASVLYERLRTERRFSGSELNVEGAVAVGDVLRLFQRGNGAPTAGLEPVNATVDLPLSDMLAWLDAGGDGDPPPLGSIRQWDLGSERGVRYGFTDAALLTDDRIVFLAGAEDSPDAVRDGEVLGTRIGLMHGEDVRWTNLVDARGEPARVKAEGVVARRDRPDALWIVLDPDDPDRPAELCDVHLEGPWR